MIPDEQNERFTWVGICVEESVSKYLFRRCFDEFQVNVVKRVTLHFQARPIVDLYSVDPIHGENPLRGKVFNDLNSQRGIRAKTDDIGNNQFMNFEKQ